MKQRLGIAQALIHCPQLLLLDEPTSALDPVGRKDILDIMASLKGELAILFSTHILSDVERVCDQIGVLHGGKLALESDVDDLRLRHNSQVVMLKIVEDHKIDAVIHRLQQQPYVIRTKKGEKGTLQITSSQIEILYAQICPILSDLQVSLEHFEVMEPNLEDVFMEVIKG
ncbi:MAG: DUF4162 domain-containing protein [Vallitaleaceae bacterium]|nr:DUF4162 domain-containing protein [Vallitaleaceae bacterium]